MSLPPTLESQSGNNPALETSFDMVGWGLIVSVGKMKLIDGKNKLLSDITRWPPTWTGWSPTFQRQVWYWPQAQHLDCLRPCDPKMLTLIFCFSSPVPIRNLKARGNLVLWLTGDLECFWSGMSSSNEFQIFWHCNIICKWKWRRGGQGSFGRFPKIHLIW